MHALVTGASSGIGEALARALGAAGYDLTLVARRAVELDRVAATAGDARVEKIAFDLTDLENIGGLVERAIAALDDIDVLVNNAGAQIVAPTEEVAVDDGEKLLLLNVFAVFRLTSAILPGMLARGSGTIVNIASMSALAPPPGMFHYSASKAALGAASESLRAEVKKRGVHVLTVYPGPVRTAMAEAAVARYARDPSGALPVGSPEELARLILRAMRRRDPRVIYPRSYTVARIFPSLMRWIVATFSPLPKSARN